jgi:pilus assembly protein CpaC
MSKENATCKICVVNRLSTATPLQVNLRVRFAEVNRSLVRSLGVNLTTADTTSGFKFGVGQGRTEITQFGPGGPLLVGTGQDIEGPGSIVGAIPGGTTLGLFGKFLGLDIGSALDLAERDGLVTVLSEPNLTALSGETAEFLAGGEFPIPLSQGLGTTTIELGSGQSFMIAGLLSNTATNTIDRAPGVGDLPILGSLFRSSTFQKGQTELVIVVTPYLVRPVDDGDIALPTDGFHTPGALDPWLGNIDNNGVSGERRPMPRSSTDAPPPAIGLNDQDAPELAADRRRETTEEQDASAAAPGFSIR